MSTDLNPADLESGSLADLNVSALVDHLKAKIYQSLKPPTEYGTQLPELLKSETTEKLKTEISKYLEAVKGHGSITKPTATYVVSWKMAKSRTPQVVFMCEDGSTFKGCKYRSNRTARVSAKYKMRNTMVLSCSFNPRPPVEFISVTLKINKEGVVE